MTPQHSEGLFQHGDGRLQERLREKTREKHSSDVGQETATTVMSVDVSGRAKQIQPALRHIIRRRRCVIQLYTNHLASVCVSGSVRVSWRVACAHTCIHVHSCMYAYRQTDRKTYIYAHRAATRMTARCSTGYSSGKNMNHASSYYRFGSMRRLGKLHGSVHPFGRLRREPDCRKISIHKRVCLVSDLFMSL